MDAHRRKTQHGKHPPGIPRCSAGPQGRAVFQIGIQRKKEQILGGQRHMAKGPLPQGRQTGKQQAAHCPEQRSKPGRKHSATGAKQRSRSPLHGKAKQDIPPKPLEGRRQDPAQQFEEDTHPGQAVSVGNDGSVGHRHRIAHSQRKRPMGIAEQHPSGVMLLDVGFVVTVQNPPVLGHIQRHGAVQHPKYRDSRHSAQQRAQSPAKSDIPLVFHTITPFRCAER